MRRLGSVGPLLFALIAAACGGPAQPVVPPTPQSTSDASIERLLDHADVDAIVSDRAGGFTRQVALLAGDLTDPELERLVPAVQEAFAPNLLRADIAAFVERDAPDAATVDRVLAFLEEGATAEVERLADAHEPEGTLEDFLRSSMENPPAEDRVELIARWVDTRGTGTFFVLVEQALDEAAYRVWRSFRPDAPSFEPLEGDLLGMRLNESFNASVVTYMRDFETVPDSLLSAATDEFGSDAGQWFVEAYSLAVASAVREAGGRTVERLAR